jgi:hypothetical protein
VNWIAKTDEEIIAATMAELERIFPTEVSALLFVAHFGNLEIFVGSIAQGGLL